MPDSDQNARIAGQAAAAAGDSLKILGWYHPYSWLGKVGVILPSANTVVEAEFNLWAPEGLTFHGARTMVAGTPSQQSLNDMAEGAIRAAGDLGTAECDLVAYCCTSGSFMVEMKETKRAMAAAAGCPVLTTADAVLDALCALGVRKVAMATPYMDFITEGEVAWLTRAGYEVVEYRGLCMGETVRERRAINRIPPEAVYRLAKDVDRPAAEAVFLSCTAMPTLGVLDRLERDLGKPVFSSNSATFRAVVKALRLTAPVENGGRLLAG